MNRGDKTIMATIVAIPSVLILLVVSYKLFKDQQMINSMKSVLAQSRVADMSKLSSYGIVDPVGRLVFPSNNVYFNFDSCCSEQQFAKSSRMFYKAGTNTEYGQTYNEWSGNLENWLPGHLTQGSFGEAEVKIQGKSYGLVIVNDTRAMKTTIIIGP